ncbi:GOLPH3/VPS74 family protein [Jidongwangia harbinensis]|uniref:GOLPH3/VPS74 family protein n=1 Tax=Jidongwangia harbinensis TaxID=2878561 RepID=UPI001CD99A42|nr:GPP34 family phosphoprotein [Jidongwangia harbinensis]MCA2212291.1 GPP34 family phosphoprotein [Jidongwangia harbinensis]
MAVPDSLPQRIFLLAHDPDKGRVRLGTNLGAMLRAAALADLYLSGHLTDENGRVAVRAREPRHDPVLDAFLDEIAGGRRRKWHSWIGRRHRATVRAVRRQLGDGGWVRLQPRKVLGLFPVTTVTIRDPRVRKDLLGRVNAALHKPVDRVADADAALVAIVAVGNLRLVLDRRTKRANKRRIRELTQLSGPIGSALRRSIEDAAAAA